MKGLLYLAFGFILSPLMFQSSLVSAGDENEFSISYIFSFPEDAIQDLPLAQPQALTIDLEGFVFVVDTGNNRIVKFDRRGRFIAAIGGFGWEREQFDRPLDISVRNGLDVFIADFNNERIERYDRMLNYISSFSAEDVSGDLQFGFPGSVDISKHGELFICDNENDSIVKLNAFGNPDLRFGDFNWGDGQLEYPIKIEVSKSDLVYVSDQGSNQIVIFDIYGNYVNRFGSAVLVKPNGLSLSADGKLYVADSGNNRTAVFDQDFQLVYFWGAKGDKIGAFNNPVDVALFEKQIYVLDSENARIQVFQLSE